MRQFAVNTKSAMAGALFTTTQQRVLGLLFGQPDRSFFTTELISLSGGGRGAVQRELQRLAGAGLVTVRPVGGQKHFQANRQAPIFQDLCGLVTKTLGPQFLLAEALRPASQRIALAVLYGSVAKGSETAGSDIDLLLVSDSLTLEEAFALVKPVEEQIGRRVSPAILTPAEFQKRRTARHPFLSKVLAGEHVVLLGDERVLGA